MSVVMSVPTPSETVPTSNLHIAGKYISYTDDSGKLHPVIVNDDESITNLPEAVSQMALSVLEGASVIFANRSPTSACDFIKLCIHTPKSNTPARISDNKEGLSGREIGTIFLFTLREKSFIEQLQETLYSEYGWSMEIGVPVSTVRVILEEPFLNSKGEFHRDYPGRPWIIDTPHTPRWY